jgi:hypothetical protein
MADKELSVSRLFSPRQIELATFLSGPFSAIYLLIANLKILGRHQLLKKVILIGVLILLCTTLAHIYLNQTYLGIALTKTDQGNSQNLENFLYTFIVWLFLKKHHLTKEEISASTQFEFRSNWKVLGFSLLGFGTLIIYGVFLLTVYAELGWIPRPAFLQ